MKESADGDNAIAVAIALTKYGPREFRFHFGDIAIGAPAARGRVSRVENVMTGAAYALERGGVRLRIDPEQDPALVLRCFK